MRKKEKKKTNQMRKVRRKMRGKERNENLLFGVERHQSQPEVL